MSLEFAPQLIAPSDLPNLQWNVFRLVIRCRSSVLVETVLGTGAIVPAAGGIAQGRGSIKYIRVQLVGGGGGRRMIHLVGGWCCVSLWRARGSCSARIEIRLRHVVLMTMRCQVMNGVARRGRRVAGRSARGRWRIMCSC